MEDLDKSVNRVEVGGGVSGGEEGDFASIKLVIDEDNNPVSPSTAQESREQAPSSPAALVANKRLRKSFLEQRDQPDSVHKLVAKLQTLLEYVAQKPALHNGTASFMRDYLRTMLIQSAADAEENFNNSELMATESNASRNFFENTPDEVVKHIFSFLPGADLAFAREVCKKWKRFGSEKHLWKALCLKKWRALEMDNALWGLIDPNIDLNTEHKWRLIYPKVALGQQWRCRLQKTGRFICHLIAHHIGGPPLMGAGLPYTLVVERRFNILHLQTFVLSDASILYFEPEEEKDREGFEDFIDYLVKRTRAGLALEDQRRFIFIPPCDYSKSLNYEGPSLLGVVQNAYPPLATA